MVLVVAVFLKKRTQFMATNQLNTSDDCPKDNELELYLLERNSNLPVSEKIQSHVESCDICKDRLKQLRGFYNLLDQEIARPIGREVYLLAKQLQNS